MMQKQQIVALTTDPKNNIYGYAVVFMQLFDYMQRNYPDLDVRVFASDGEVTKMIANKGFESIKLKPKVSIIHNGLYLTYSFIRRVAKMPREVIIVSNTEMPELLAAALLSFKYKRVYCFIHDYETGFRHRGTLYHSIRKILIGRIKNIMVSNELHKAQIEIDVKNANCIVLPNPIFV